MGVALALGGSISLSGGHGIAIELGMELNMLLEYFGVIRSYIADIYDLPVCRHCADQYHPRSIQKNDLAYGTTTLALFSDLILGLFLATSLMSLQL